jgi:hypothetical protein
LYLIEAHDRANAVKLNDVDALEELVRLRAGDEAAADRLKKGLEYLTYETAFDWSHKSGKRRPGDIIGSCFIGLYEAIERIADSNATDPTAYVRQELSRQVHARRREISRNILPSPQTNSYRKREGLPLYQPLIRVECVPHDDVEVNPLEQMAYSGPDLRDDYYVYRGPSKYHNAADGENMVDLLDEFSDDPDLVTVVELTRAGHTIKHITCTTHLTEYRVRKLRKEIVRRLGGEELTTPDVTVELANAPEALHHPAELELALAV